jgi:hypothetical protein
MTGSFEILDLQIRNDTKMLSQINSFFFYVASIVCGMNKRNDSSAEMTRANVLLERREGGTAHCSLIP